MIPEDHGYLVPIGDVHLGDRAFGKEGRKKLKGYLDWVAERDNARIFLMGDIYNAASRESKTSPFDSDSSEYGQAIDLFEPYKDKIVGAIDGNHEARMMNSFGVSPTELFCKALDIPYCGWSALLHFKVGQRTDGGAGVQSYNVFCHHLHGGGGSPGAALNKVTKLQEMIEGVDVYCGGHLHQLACAVRSIYTPLPRSYKVVERKIHYVQTGAYLSHKDSYAEQFGLAPAKLGSPRIRFSGEREKHDVHISI